ncbi:hypothetical protein Ancab_039632 [Ancistrocladus abbreviatus]
MSCLFQLSSHSTSILSKATRFVATNSLYGCSTLSWKRSIDYPCIRAIKLQSVFSRIRVQCYSLKRSRWSQKSDPQLKMEGEKGAFFVVRKGDLVGVYKTLSECQAQVGTSVSHPPVSVYKGCSLPKDSEEYLASCGLQNALYTIKAEDLKEDLFGKLVPCLFQEPGSFKGEASSRVLSQKRPHEALESENVGEYGSTLIPINPLGKHLKIDCASSDSLSCILEFDGASKGNPGLAGAGVVLLANDGSLICRLRQGLGTATNNAAEYRAVILGLKYALEKGFRSIHVRGDSKLVCMQGKNDPISS